MSDGNWWVEAKLVWRGALASTDEVVGWSHGESCFFLCVSHVQSSEIECDSGVLTFKLKIAFRLVLAMNDLVSRITVRSGAQKAI